MQGSVDTGRPDAFVERTLLSHPMAPDTVLLEQHREADGSVDGAAEVSPLPTTGALPMVWPTSSDTSVSERAQASAVDRFCPTELAQEEPLRSSACVSPPYAIPAHRQKRTAS